MHVLCTYTQGAMAAAFVAERFGRKGGLFIAAFFFHVGSLMQTTARTGGQSAQSALTQLYVGRAIGGFGVGMVSVIVPTVRPFSFIEYLGLTSPLSMSASHHPSTFVVD